MEIEKNGKQNTNSYFTLKSNEEIEAEENEVREKKVWLEAIIKQAEFGYEDAQLTLGEYYLERYGVDEDEEDQDRGIYWLKKRAGPIFSKMTEAAEQGDIDAMFELAQGGKGDSEDSSVFTYNELDVKDTVYWYLIAAQEGHAEAQYILSRYYTNGWYLHYGFSYNRWSVIPFEAQDEDRNFDVDRFEEAVDWEDFNGWVDKGELLAGGFSNEKRNVEKATEWLIKSAEQGFADAQNQIGDYYSNFVKDTLKTFPKDDAEAFSWYSKAAELGNAKSQKRLGDYYSSPNGDSGVQIDDEKALFWYKKAGEDHYVSCLSYLKRLPSDFGWDEYIKFCKDFGYILGEPVGDFLVDGNILKACNRSATEAIIPDGIVYVGKDAFHSCESLKSVKFPDSVTELGYRAFLGCRSLTSINLPSNLTKLGDCAFVSCSSLESLTINSNIDEVNEAFYGCDNLTSVIIPEDLAKSGIIEKLIDAGIKAETIKKI